MKFSKREDIEAPADFVFRAMSDFQALERAAMRRGIEVSRLDARTRTEPGMSWLVRAPVRGRIRDITITLTRCVPDQVLETTAESGGIDALGSIELVALSRTRTRVQVGLEVKPKTFTTRLLVQSLKLAKHTLDARFARRVAEMARHIEKRQGQTKLSRA